MFTTQGYLGWHWLAVAVATALTIAAGVWARRATGGVAVEPDAYGTALLAGGHCRVAHTALAGLVARRAVRVDRLGRVHVIDGALPADPVEGAVLTDLRAGGGLAFPAFAANQAYLDLLDRMAAAGHVPERGRVKRVRGLVWLWAAIVAAGAVRFAVSAHGGSLAGDLLLALAVTAVLAAVLFKWIGDSDSPRPTRRGRRARAVARRAAPVAGAVLLPVALVGLSAYPDPEVATVLTAVASSEERDTNGCGGCGD
ncbi:TIGR04222 domain-containing membrane protein [Actinokineospora soli]|uniref:TIGR04222 domain-containing membrane protein n=1 Tax=Actinokineospora soli TaxID=1048753 RepID=A0ABW2TL17_9PSEU